MELVKQHLLPGHLQAVGGQLLAGQQVRKGIDVFRRNQRAFGPAVGSLDGRQRGIAPAGVVLQVAFPLGQLIQQAALAQVIKHFFHTRIADAGVALMQRLQRAQRLNAGAAAVVADAIKCHARQAVILRAPLQHLGLGRGHMLSLVSRALLLRQRKIAIAQLDACRRYLAAIRRYPPEQVGQRWVFARIGPHEHIRRHAGFL